MKFVKAAIQDNTATLKDHGRRLDQHGRLLEDHSRELAVIRGILERKADRDEVGRR
jgi:hypothetical protein